MVTMPPLHVDAHILVVDDNAANVELLIALLEDEGYRHIEGTCDPREVESRVAKQCPALILLDVRMPYLSGFDVMQQLSALGDQAPAVIILTAQIDTATRYRALELGARDFLTKPFDHLEVLQRINNTLQLQRLMNERLERAELLESLVQERTQELARRALQEPLTGLPNRRALLNVIQQQLDTKCDTIVMFLAIEGIDEIARLHGFTVADQVAFSLAQRLRAQLDASASTLGVWNSTEWVVQSPCALTNEAVGPLVQGVLGCFEYAFEIEQMQLHLGVRIGVSASLPGRKTDQLVRMAALALPQNVGCWQGYNDQLEHLLQRRTGLRNGLRTAVQQHELYLAYQPKVDLESNQVCGVEALLRWDSPVYGHVSPAEFIPLAEASGEILGVGAWVIQEAVAALVRWRCRGDVDDAFSVAVNVAPLQLAQPDFAQRLMQCVSAAGLPPHCLEIEVTESGLMQDMELALRQLQALSQAGFRVAIDDFGTGYSSLAYLKKLPVSVLKIDRAFIRELDTNVADQKLTETVIGMAGLFGFSTVAEGVEHYAQLKLLKDMKCDVIQGFIFAPPLKEAVLLKIIKQPMCNAVTV
ncbi:EAL domain-containing protein (putative c-di-GMP-specific phosphodiesterase class I) [Marinobacterium halophilum]|uniref:EAL domain-containing protein (Putative c-di-GMP-specific phosphodiesterase class I) n=2 Tax=Marinobacterium halophilum TaxID=267374 RepID=A0A2P8ER10_9GAMM|nr:EAL domain-containing protein (putative c-di-GMP-specific phosphodiesterase class I) [Marinobacterium halophilum]